MYPKQVIFLGYIFFAAALWLEFIVHVMLFPTIHVLSFYIIIMCGGGGGGNSSDCSCSLGC